MSRLFDLDFQLLADSVLTIIAVMALFFALSYFLFDPVRNLMEERQRLIAADIANANKDKEDAALLKEQYDDKLRQVDKEAEEILSEARKKALKNEAKILEDAKLEAARIMERTGEEVELEKKRAMDEVKQEMISVATVMAEKVIAANMDVSIQDSLVDETLKEMGESTWQS